MKVEQIYTGCLAQGAYYIASEGEAVIIDPLREIQPYLDRAAKDGTKIKYILETHFHADFVSGHLDLAKATGATIVYGPTAKPAFEAHVATDGEVLKVGKVQFKVLHTPGHTMESSCFLLINEAGKDEAVFTGDTLFIGDVGRPDLAQKAANLTQEQLAALLYHSLRDKVMTLADEVIVYPAHGAGSACGKNMSKETVSTIGEQKAKNYALRADMTEQEFIAEVTDGLLPPPAYFPMNVAMNKLGYDSITEVLKRGLTPLSPSAFEAAANETGAMILDVRKAAVFKDGFIPNAINIGLDGQFAPWVGALIPDVKQQILLITEVGGEEEAITRLARVGYDYVIGYLEGGFEAWKTAGKEVDTVTRITADEFAKGFANEALVIDLRRQGEYSAEHLDGAKNIPLDYINEHLAEFPKDTPFTIHCAGGYRSMIAASILKSRGWSNFKEVEGGFGAISKTNVPKTNFVCPSTLK
ncbi:Glyoxylase, beta-lactamase superfamily II [Flexibacter flexilis DSM 6793]|uniref:Glyoxylase, beta-lactamase superfamily II n=1 Tax=Flexibacter flexilis DSM 6793 TaxID=927664 RepID=A0A1I1FZE5_9BACT|nr:MBL fold metallo-hydrolase [Flexibacter flexilis]SFC02433.1 Glyoxylase, beta-lactamase superfamily II [Flexibacter flexilis DSM 6793]